MSIKGRPIQWLDAAIDRGDAAGAISAAAEVDRVDLDYALALLILMSEWDPDRYDRAAERWVTRWMDERADPKATTGERGRWQRLLHEMPSLEAVTTLAAVCERLGLEQGTRALVHLYPRVR